MMRQRFSSIVSKVARESKLFRAAPSMGVFATGIVNTSSSMPSLRFFATKNTKPPKPVSLPEMLANEITSEEAEDNVDPELEDLTNEIKKNFTITDKEGSAVVHLSRKYKNETIEVSFNCQDETELDDFNQLDEKFSNIDDNGELIKQDGDGDEDEDDDFGGGMIGQVFEVTVTKGDQKVLFSCVAEEEIRIENVTYLGTRNKGDDQFYAGPLYDHLDDTLKASMSNYLSERKIDDDLCYFILKYARHKEQNEYMNWLKQMLNFTDGAPAQLPSAGAAKKK